MLKLVWITPSSCFIHFKYPDLHEDLELFELAAIMNHLCFIISDHTLT